MKISKNKIMITAIIVLCVAVAVLAAVLVIRKDKNKDNDDKYENGILKFSKKNYF